MTAGSFDVAIVGGGAAGCAAALALEGSGRTIALLGADKPALGCGEVLPHAARRLLRELGAEQVLAAGPHRLEIASYAAWDARILAYRHAIAQVEPGYVIDRSAFDIALREAARRTSARVMPAAVAGAVRRRGLWSLPLADGSALEARFVLDCSGRATIVARRYSTRVQVDRLVAATSGLTQHDTSVDPSEATLVEAVETGWWFATLTPDRRMSLMWFSDADLLPRGLSRSSAAWQDMVRATHFIGRWLESAGFAAQLPPRLRGAGTSWLTSPGGDGWLAAGDAAVAFDPLSSHGVTTALWTGRQAARAALACLQGDHAPAARYTADLSRAAQQFVAQRRTIYARARRFRHATFWQRRIAPNPAHCVFASTPVPSRSVEPNVSAPMPTTI